MEATMITCHKLGKLDFRAEGINYAFNGLFFLGKTRPFTWTGLEALFGRGQREVILHSTSNSQVSYASG